MDPFTAIGLAGNILTFIDYGSKVIGTSIEIYESASGSTQDGQISDTIATEMKKFAAKLQPPDKTQLLGEEKDLCNLATDCEFLAKRILDILEKFKPKNRKSIRSSLVAGIKTKWYEGERRSIEEQLSHCRAQLGLRLSSLTSSETQARLNALVISAKDDSSKLEQLLNQVENLHRGVAVESLTPTAQAQLKSLLGMSEHAYNVIVQHRILESLAFGGMYGRYETVDDAHFKTLRWIFDDNLPDGRPLGQFELGDNFQDEARASARQSLLNWISSGTGIFHISGKLGSGKSTLMKYLCGHNRTKALLEQWSGHRQIVFASFFFWKPGSTMQKSLTGLIRSLLHDVLKACPELIPDILPDYWDRVKSMPWQVQSKLPLSDKNIREAFSRLISDPKLYTNHCFCFFIDGLDEYEGTYQEDPRTLVELLSSWTELAPTTVKICVSSREYNVFINAFSNDQRICLQDLTTLDITRYALDKLQHMGREADRMTLANAIVVNAQGIFVWVTLVVKRIREQIENGANLEALQQEIDSLPKELEGLFEHIISSLVDSDLKVAYQAFSMVVDLNQSHQSLSLFSYSFLDEFTQDPVFASREDFQCRLLTPEARAVRIEFARKRLNGCCKGLLETRQDPREVTSESITITHRSISEFLSSQTKRNGMDQYLVGFNAVDAISQLTLAELWSRDAGNIIRRSNFDELALALVRLRIEAKLDYPPYPFLVSLALAWQRHQGEGKYNCVGENLYISVGYWAYVFIGFIPGPGVPKERKSSQNQDLRHPIYAAASFGSYDYVIWELGRNPEAIRLFTPLRLLNCISLPREEKYKKEQNLGGVIDYLHTHHDLNPETISTLLGSPFHPVSLDPERKYYRNNGDESTEVSLWHNILLRCCAAELFSARDNQDRKDLCLLGWIIEKFLEYGADPYFQRSITNSPSFLMRLVVRVRGELQEQCLSFKRPIHLRPKDIDQTPYVWKQALYECEDISLSELVVRWDFENKTRVLELIKKNTLMLEATSENNGTPLLVEEETLENSSAVLGMEDSVTLEAAKLLSSEPILDKTETFSDLSLKKDGLVGTSGFESQKKLLRFIVAVSISILIFSIIISFLI